ncbi:MAG: hypothetical protein WC848_05460 [Parcubacteria group bacterium]|jgi:hypothetical protein
MRNDLYERLREGKLLVKIPMHEIEEEILGIRADDFEEQAGRNKLITDSLLNANLDNPFVFWKIGTTTKDLVLKVIFLIATLLSVIGWLHMIAIKSFMGSQYGFLFSVLSLFTVWFIQKNEITPGEAIDRYDRARKESRNEKSFLEATIQRYNLAN